MIDLRRLSPLVLAATLLAGTAAFAQAPQADPDHGDNPATFSPQDQLTIVREVQHKLLSLARYSVFDSLSFGIRGRTVILEGFASRPVLKSDAESAVKSIPGVTSVDNQIKVLPLSPMDDRIRAAVYRRIYSQPTLRKYTGSPVGFGRLPSGPGGITQNPPLGYNAIHIIVDNGHVTLTGVVDNETDSNIAYIQANSTPGTFAVDNDLRIAGKSAAAK